MEHPVQHARAPDGTGSVESFALAQRLDALPVLPMVVARLLSLDAQDEAYFEKVVDLVGLEPTFAARLMVAANSVESRGHREIRTIRDAVVRLGARRVSGLIVGLSVVRVFVPRTALQRSLWLHAVEVACGARALAQVCGDNTLDPEQVYLAGLMHDIGHFLIMDSSAEELERVEKSGWEKPDELVVAEHDVLGFDHAELGALAGERWGLPSDVNSAVRHHHHHHIEATLGAPAGRIAQLVQASDYAMFGALRRGETQRPFDEDPHSQQMLRDALPKWFPRFTPRMLTQIARAQADAESGVKTLGL